MPCDVVISPVVYQRNFREEYTKAYLDMYLIFSCVRLQYRPKYAPYVNWLMQIVKSEVTLKFEKCKQDVEDKQWIVMC